MKWLIPILIVLGLQTLYRGPYLPKDSPCPPPQRTSGILLDAWWDSRAFGSSIRRAA